MELSVERRVAAAVFVLVERWLMKRDVRERLNREELAQAARALEEVYNALLGAWQYRLRRGGPAGMVEAGGVKWWCISDSLGCLAVGLAVQGLLLPDPGRGLFAAPPGGEPVPALEYALQVAREVDASIWHLKKVVRVDALLDDLGRSSASRGAAEVLAFLAAAQPSLRVVERVAGNVARALGPDAEERLLRLLADEGWVESRERSTPPYYHLGLRGSRLWSLTRLASRGARLDLDWEARQLELVIERARRAAEDYYWDDVGVYPGFWMQFESYTVTLLSLLAGAAGGGAGVEGLLRPLLLAADLPWPLRLGAAAEFGLRGLLEEELGAGVARARPIPGLGEAGEPPRPWPLEVELAGGTRLIVVPVECGRDERCVLFAPAGARLLVAARARAFRATLMHAPLLLLASYLGALRAWVESGGRVADRVVEAPPPLRGMGVAVAGGGVPGVYVDAPWLPERGFMAVDVERAPARSYSAVGLRLRRGAAEAG